MKKLELKHWLSYSGLGVQVYGSSDFFTLRSAVPYEDEIELHLHHPIYGNCSGTSLEYSLVLRNLSDLTKEIEVNCEKFIPIQKLKYPPEAFRINMTGLRCVLIKEDWARLYEMHFDVDNLIDAGLAIDINTLNIQEK